MRIVPADEPGGKAGGGETCAVSSWLRDSGCEDFYLYRKENALCRTPSQTK